MNFVNGRVLYAIPVVVSGVIWFLWWSWRKRQALSRLFVSERLLPQLLEGFSPARRKWKMVLQVAAVLFLMLALARPQWGFVWEEANQRGRDILVAIDTSRSMLATDMAPNRLTRAKLAALDLMRLAKNDRLGLIAFAGAAFLQSPLTLDDEAFRQSVEALDTTIIPQGGTAITEAIQTAVTAFATEEGDNHKVLIIFTDGEDQDGGAQMAAEDADNHHLKIFTVGVGTPAGELIKIIDERGQSSYVKDEQGNVVKSRLNEDLLRQIATAAKGFYIPLRDGNAMQVLYQQGLAPLPTSDISSKLVRHLNEQFQWPLGIAIALLLIEALLPDAPKKRTEKLTTMVEDKAGRVGKAVAVATLLLVMLAGSAQASPARALRDYQEGRFKDARNEYERLLGKKPDDPKLNYNGGAAAYRAGSYDAAAKGFMNATKAPELDLQESAYYNLGNSNFRLGGEQTAPDKKMALWHEAVQNYESALKLNPKDTDAQFNRDLVKQELERLKQQQQQKNQDKKDNKDQNKDDKNQTDKNQQEQKKDQSKDKDNKDQKQDDQQKQEQKDKQDSKSDEQKKQEQQQRDQQKKEQEQKEKEQQQQQQAQNDKKEGDRNDKPEAKNKGDQEQASDQKKADQQNEAEQEARAAQLAQMTPRQAQQMLDAQKSEEKALIYRQYDERKKTRNRIFKDW